MNSENSRIPDDEEANVSIFNFFVDEAGDPTLFDAKGRIVVGEPGCSKYFILGKMRVDDLPNLAGELETLRSELLTDPYFKGVPSMQPERRKTAIIFHAKDDPAEVRREVFKLLTRHPLRFYAVVRDKNELLAYVRQQNERDKDYRYRGDELYDSMVSELFGKFHGVSDQVNICFAKRGSRNRNQALREALKKANQTFLANFGFSNNTEMEIASSTPEHEAGLQAVDYFLWAVQRFYERSEERYIELIWPQVAEIHDLDFVEDGRRGAFYRKDKPLNLAARKGAKK